MNTANRFLVDIIEAADANGWMVIEAQMKEPGWITLSDRRGNELTVRSPYGLGTKALVERAKAIEPYESEP